AAPAPAPAAKGKAKSKPKAKPKAKGRGKGKAKAEPAPVAAADAPYAERWAAYMANLPPASARFLELLEEKGTLTVSEAVKILGLKTPKAMGGLTGAMRRWAPKQNITLPFTAKKTPDNERCWEWTGHTR
ncbi:MAG: hypothetical protein KC613_20945, partial [Myxococcales bacterium]|nr:hypothetical protein [Myxococcales bacterium]